MVEKRRGLPVGLLVATPPMLAGLCLGLALFIEGVLHRRVPGPLEELFDSFGDEVLEPSLELVGLSDLSGVTLWKRMLVDLTVYFGFFFLVGLVLGGIAAVVNLLVFGGGAGGEEG